MKLNIIASARTTALLLVSLLGLPPLAPAATLLDVWRADDLILNDGDALINWTSASNRPATPVVGNPILKLNATPAGGKVVRFNRQRMSVSSNPIGGRTAFSLVYVFKADAAGANDSGANWYGKSGIIDAEQGGVTADWGTVITETGNVGFGIGAADTSSYSTGASLVDSNYHVAVFAWGGGTQTIYVDTRAPVSTASATAARNNAAFSIGGINTDENGAVRRFVGDLAEIRFYDTSLTSLEASNVISELRDLHIFGNLPRIQLFTASTNFIYAGAPVTLAWNVTNAPSVIIDSGVGAVPPVGNTVVYPGVTTTYSLTATNTNGVRVASVSVVVDPGVPTARSIVTNTPQNTARTLTLQGTDPQGSNLTYSIVATPAHGDLTGLPPAVTYTPTNNYNGFDSFTFKVNDGSFDSAPATVTIKVVAPPTPPAGLVLSSTNINVGTGPGNFIAALQAIDVNEFDTHTFALVPAFGQNAQFSISGNVLNAGATFAGGPGAVFGILLRVTDSTGLTNDQAFTLTVVDVPHTVLINEIHYNPEDNTSHESFIELHNPSDTAVDVSVWRLRGGIDYFIPANTFIPARGFLVVAEDPATISNRFGVIALGPWTGGINNDGEEISVRDSLNDVVDKVDFKSEFPWPIAADGGGASAQLINPLLDNNLGSSWRSGGPTPGATNSIFATNAAPNIRQVDHSPNWPASTNQVVVTAKVTDPNGVASVALAYQVVAPGQFLPATLPLTTAQLNNFNTTPLTNSLNPAFELPANWTTVAMHDDGLNGDAVAGDSVYSVMLPQQANRTLVRYRLTCTDLLGAARRAPFEDDPSLNFAYFVYDGVPAYQGFSSALLQTLPIYFTLTRDADINQCTAWFNGGDQLGVSGNNGAANDGRLYFNWEAAFVSDGKVFDHVMYRLRGANGRYQPGKRSFRFKFNDGALFQARDNNGKKYPTKWREVVTGKGQSNRGTEHYALNEVVNLFLWNKVGVPAPQTHYFHFRVIRGASEAGADQYSGDFWGLNFAQEKYDVNFLDAHNLPKGNLYKLNDHRVDWRQEQRYQGGYAPTNGADFDNVQNNLNGFQTTNWLFAHANYTNWYRYHVICEGIRHWDFWPSANKNGAWYFEPIYSLANSNRGRLLQMPYDTTDTWGPTWNNGYDLMYNGIFNVIALGGNTTGGDTGENLEMQKEYRNVAREIRALLFQPDQINGIIDAYAAGIAPFVPADRARWLNSPSPSSYNSLFVPLSPGVTNGLTSYVLDMKNFMFAGGNNAWWVGGNSVGAGGWVTRLDTISTDAAIPVRPTITYVGSNGFPVSGLTFSSSAYSDPQGAGTFGAIQWRIAEVLATNMTVTNPSQLRLEWDAAWTSPEMPSFNATNTFPEFAVQAGLRYRARVRHQDNTGRWSAWSLPAEFVPSPSDTTSALRTNLVFNEIMFNPPGAGAIDGDEFEFLELKNIGSFSLNLSGLFFSQGINFTFANGTTLAPGAVFLLARNAAQIASRYPGVVPNGIYTGKLNNDGETVALSHPTAGEIISLAYGDRAPWPVTADGFGFSIVRDAATGRYGASAALYGTPGVDGGLSGIGGVVINEILSNSTLPARDFIELLNTLTNNVDISGWYLSDDPAFPQKFRIPARAPLAPGAFAVFTEDEFNPTPGLGTSFSLSSFGDEVYVFSADAGGLLTGYSYGLSFGAAADGETLGRHFNSVGEEQFPAQLTPTPGATNAGPRIGPVVFSEINYNPEPGGDEFVEVKNITASAVALFDPANPTNTWRVNGLGFSFPTNFTLGSNEVILITVTNPAVFRAKYGVPLSVTILGPCTGSLQDSGEKLELQRPDVPTTNGIPWVTIDEVRYNDRAPWPSAADGNGPSLQRLNAAAYGNDPINWTAAGASLGTDFAGGTAPAITSHPANQSTAVGGSAMFSVSFTGAAPVNFRWRLAGTNLPGATNTTLLLTGVQLSQAGTYDVVAFNSAGAAISSNATLVVLSPVAFTVQPLGQNVQPGTNVTLNSLAVGNGPVRYQWRFEGTNILNATNSSYSFTGANITNHHGNFSVVTTDDISSATSSNAFIYVLLKPGVTVAIMTNTILQGASVTLSVTATGAPPIYYRWLRQGSAFFTSSVPFVTVTNVQAGGRYQVVVTNLAGASAASPGAGITNVFVLADLDHDGVADLWELAYGFNTNNAADALLDFDGDGMNNRDEYLSGTNPTNALSVLKIVLSATNAALLNFTAQSNLSYTVQWRTNLVAPAWSNLTSITALPLVRTVLVNSASAPAAPERYLRIVTPLVP